ncbi:hypothetical protein [Embleya sp. AB8]|uniref:hypothetical protein n=1 Tax=Embleya sp. AB8 TaxID=3156304 RepID=UPI003C747757
MLRRLSWLFALPVLISALAFGAFVTPASAAQSGLLEDSAVLTPLDGSTVPPDRCVESDRRLDAGTYAWTIHTPDGTPPEKNLYLRSDSYKWTLCLSAQAGFYKVTTSLTSTTPGGSRATRSYVLDVPVKDTYTWSAEFHSV